MQAIISIVLIYFLMLFLNILKYNKSGYRKASGNGYFFTIKDKGSFGEFKIYRKLESLNIYKKILVNIYVPTGIDEYSETDLVMITNTGIYVIESKNYQGLIYGNQSQRNWTQVFNENSKFKFLNPTWQNKGHITALSNFLGLKQDIFKSYVVFGENCTLKDITVNSNNVQVLKVDDLLKVVNEDINESSNILTNEQIDKIAGYLERHVKVSWEVKRTHIKNAQRKKAEYAQSKDSKLNSDAKICPKCKSELVLRIATKGKNKGNQFYGCSNYPKCRYIESLDN